MEQNEILISAGEPERTSGLSQKDICDQLVMSAEHSAGKW